MGDLLTGNSSRVPLFDSGAYGKLRSQALDAVVLGLASSVPRGVQSDLTAWVKDVIGTAGGGSRGLDYESVPPAWFEVLCWAGVPFARHGELKWGQDLLESDVKRPMVLRDALQLPSPDRLMDLSSLGIKPMRLFLSQKLGCRLQSAAGVRLYLWPSQAVVVSQVDIPLGGFIYGPNPGQRFSMALNPGGYQMVTW